MASTIKFFIIIQLIYFGFCLASEQILNTKSNTTACDCYKIRCNKTVSFEYCHRIKGKYITNSIDNCVCCPTCIVKQPFGESCFPSEISGVDIKCGSKLYCETRYEHLGHICLEIKRKLEFEQKAKPMKHKKIKELKMIDKLKKKMSAKNRNWFKLEINKDINKSLKRTVRSPLKLDLLGNKDRLKTKKRDKDLVNRTLDVKSNENTVLDKTIASTKSQLKQELTLEIEKLKEVMNAKKFDKNLNSVQFKNGSQSAIKKNNGPVFNINNNYYAYVSGKLTKLKELPKGVIPITVKGMKEPTEVPPNSVVTESKPEKKSKIFNLKTVITISGQKYGLNGIKSKRVIVYNGSVWRKTEENGKTTDSDPDEDDLKILSEKIINPEKGDKAIIDLEEVEEIQHS